MLQSDIAQSQQTQVLQFYDDEIKYAKAKLSKNEIFKACEHECSLIEDKIEKKIQSLEKCKGNKKPRVSLRIPWMTNYSNIGAD